MTTSKLQTGSDARKSWLAFVVLALLFLAASIALALWARGAA